MLHAYLSLSYSYAKTAASRDALKYMSIITQEWTDSNMRWNTTEYNNVKDIRVPPARLWKPDILMYNR